MTTTCTRSKPAHLPPLDRAPRFGLALLGVGLALAAGAAAARSTRGDARLARSLAGRVVLITGGSRGLGLALAREFHGRGAKVAICARDHLELSRARASLQDGGRGPEIFALVCDITDRSSVERLVTTVDQRLAQGAGIDILVNNAGTMTLGPMETMTVDDYNQAMKVHFWGPLYAILAALPGMRRHASEPGGTPRWRHIINISSIGGKIGMPHLAPYSASKFALQGLSESLRAELEREHIHVMSVCPGVMRTGGHYNAAYKGRHSREFALLTALNLVPGLSMSAEQAARRIVDSAVRGERDVVLGASARFAAMAHGIAPGLVARLESLAVRLLPDARGPESIGRDYATGLESRPWPGGPLGSLAAASLRRSAQRHNQFSGLRRSGVARDV